MCSGMGPEVRRPQVQLCRFQGKASQDRWWKKGGGRRPLSTDLELNLFQYLEEERAQGRAQGRVVTNLDLSRKAIRIAEGLALQNFKASPGWLLNWKRRHSVGIRCGTNSSQKVPADFAEQIHDFWVSIIRLRKAKDIQPSQIINMDQTMCRFDMPTNDLRDNSHKDDKG